MKINNSTELANYIKLYRSQDQKRSQSDVAEYAGMKQKTISAIETTAGTSRIETLFKVAHELGLSVELTPNKDIGTSCDKPQWEEEW